MLVLLFIISFALFFIAVKVNSIYQLVSQRKQQEYIDSVVSETMEERIQEEDENDLIFAEEFVARTGKASTSALQSEFLWGYNKAARIMTALEQEEIVGPMRAGERYREVFVKPEEDTDTEELFRN
jgi:DNA segregation ATPase FtsK/SpoIIIE-like protein